MRPGSPLGVIQTRKFIVIRSGQRYVARS